MAEGEAGETLLGPGTAPALAARRLDAVIILSAVRWPFFDLPR